MNTITADYVGRRWDQVRQQLQDSGIDFLALHASIPRPKFPLTEEKYVVRQRVNLTGRLELVTASKMGPER